MGAFVIGEAFGQFCGYILVALVVVYLTRNVSDHRPPHLIAFVLVCAWMFATNYRSDQQMMLGIYSLALVGAVLQWTYRRATKRPPSGFARLYAIFVGLAIALSATLIMNLTSDAHEAAGVCGGLLLGIYLVRFLTAWVWRGFFPNASVSEPREASEADLRHPD